MRVSRRMVLLLLLASGIASADGTLEKVTWSPNGRYALYTIHIRDAGPDELWLADRRTLAKQRVTDALVTWDWAPDGRTFLYQWTDQSEPDFLKSLRTTVVSVDEETFALRQVRVFPMVMKRPTFVHSESRFLAWGPKADTFVMDVATSKVDVLQGLPSGDNLPSPDGQLLLYCSSDWEKEGPRCRLGVYNMSSRESRTVHQCEHRGGAIHHPFEWDGGPLAEPYWAPDSKRFIVHDAGSSRLLYLDVESGKSALFDSFKTFNCWHWSQDSKKWLGVRAGGDHYDRESFQAAADAGDATVGWVDAETLTWHPIALMDDPYLVDGFDINGRAPIVLGPGLSVWSADGTRSVFRGSVLDDPKSNHVGLPRYKMWDAKAAHDMEVPEGYLPAFPVGSNTMEFLPEMGYLHAGRLKKK